MLHYNLQYESSVPSLCSFIMSRFSHSRESAEFISLVLSVYGEAPSEKCL